MAALVEVIHGEHFAEVRMSSPPVNAFSLAFFDELSCALREAMPGMGALVLTSAVDGIFAAGGDLPYMAQADEAESKRYVELCQEIYCLLESPDYVSIVAMARALAVVWRCHWLLTSGSRPPGAGSACQKCH